MLLRPALLLLPLLPFALGMAGGARAQALDEIRRTGVIRVCIWPDYFGISYRSPRTGALQGLDIDLSRELGRDLSARVEYVETDFSRLLDDLQARKCQIAMMAVGVTAARAARVDFSAPYLRSDIYAIATRTSRAVQRWDDIDQPGRVVVVQKGTYMEPLMRKTLEHATLRAVERPQEREHEVESGRADVFITDYPYSRRMLMNTDWARLVSPTRTIQLTDYAYAAPKGDAPWLQRINEFVAQIKRDGRLVQAAARHGLQPIVARD
jgi:ABC-type amino acid transport substrate-binding protein